MGFDYRGFKPSENVHPCLPKYTTLETEVEDVANAFTFMQIQPEVDPERCGLLGWGVGGAVCVTVAARDKEVKAIATLNSFVNGERWMISLERALHASEKTVSRELQPTIRF